MNIILPINFFLVIKIFGAFVFPFIPNWQEQIEIHRYAFFDLYLETTNDKNNSYLLTNSLANLGFSTSLLLNCDITLSVILLLIIIFLIARKYYN
jgi:hypothetical protein